MLGRVQIARWQWDIYKGKEKGIGEMGFKAFQFDLRLNV